MAPNPNDIHLHSIRNIGTHSYGNIIGIKTTPNIQFLIDEIPPKTDLFMISCADSHKYPHDEHLALCAKAKEKGYRIIIDELWSKKRQKAADMGFDTISFYQIFNPKSFEELMLKEVRYDFAYCIGGIPYPIPPDRKRRDGITHKRFHMLSDICERYHNETGKKSFYCFGNMGKHEDPELPTKISIYNEQYPWFTFKCFSEQEWFVENQIAARCNVTASIMEGGPRLFTHACALGIKTLFHEDIIEAMGFPSIDVMEYFETYKTYEELLYKAQYADYERGNVRLKSSDVKDKLFKYLTTLGYEAVNLRDDSYYLCSYNTRRRSFHYKPPKTK
jgi:hypothetical protein